MSVYGAVMTRPVQEQHPESLPLPPRTSGMVVSRLQSLASSLFVMVLGTRLVVTGCTGCMWKPPVELRLRPPAALVELRLRPPAVLLTFPCGGSGRRQTRQWRLVLHTVDRKNAAWLGIPSASTHSISSSVFHLTCLPVGSGRVLTSALPSAGLCRGGERDGTAHRPAGPAERLCRHHHGVPAEGGRRRAA